MYTKFIVCNVYRKLIFNGLTVFHRNSTDMTTLATSYIIPVDLNTFIFKVRYGACHDISIPMIYVFNMTWRHDIQQIGS
jgi:hypothetical protein